MADIESENERRALLEKFISPLSGLTMFFSTLCIVDLFGVFPIVALPRAVIDCGWLGLPLVVAVFLIQIYTAILLGRCWVIAQDIDPLIISKSRYPYAAVAELTCGTLTRKIVIFLLDVTIFGAGIPNLLLASQNMNLIGMYTSDGRFDISYCYWLLFLGFLLGPIMWLGSPKDMKWLAALSVCVVLLVAFLTWSCMILDFEGPAAPNIPSPTLESIFIAYGIIAFQFDIHPTVLTLQVDMHQKSKLGFSVILSFIVTGSLCCITTVIAMIKYGDQIRWNLVQGLPSSSLLFVDIFFITVQICLSMVVGGSALFQDIEDRLGIPREFNWQRCAVRALILFSSIFIGESVPRFDLIMGLIGGSLTGPLMFVFPLIFYFRLRHLQILHRKGIKPNRLVRNNFVYKPTNTCSSSSEMLIRFIPADVEEVERITVSKQSSSVVKTRRQSLENGANYDDDATTSYKKFYASSAGFGKFSEENKKISFIEKISDVVDLDRCLTFGPMNYCEIFICGLIIVLGCIATVAATFFSFQGTINYAMFTPPCILGGNSSLGD